MAAMRRTQHHKIVCTCQKCLVHIRSKHTVMPQKNC